MDRNKFLSITVGLLFALGCGLFSPVSNPTPDLLGTLQASTPSSLSSSVPGDPISTPDFNFPTIMSTLPSNSGQVSIPPPSPSDQLIGHIVFTCQVFKVTAMDQVCLMNADGSGVRRLTTNNNVRHFYPSLSPDGQSVLYTSFREQNVYEIYSLDLNNNTVERLTDRLGILTAPEFSPDGESITFARGSGNPGNDQSQIMTMNRKGENAGNIPQILGWDPTWSPDGKQILFASSSQGAVQLFVVNQSGKGLRQVTNLPAIRGRSDWSTDGQLITTYSGPSWNREIYVMNADGSNVLQLTPTGGNSQGPSFSPDGHWGTFPAYVDKYGDDHGCEIYIIRIDGSNLRRLTNMIIAT